MQSVATAALLSQQCEGPECESKIAQNPNVMSFEQLSLLIVGIIASLNVFYPLVIGAIPIRAMGTGMNFSSWSGAAFFFQWFFHFLLSAPTMVYWIMTYFMDDPTVHLLFSIWIVAAWGGIFGGFWLSPLLFFIGQFADDHGEKVDLKKDDEDGESVGYTGPGSPIVWFITTLLYNGGASAVIFFFGRAARDELDRRGLEETEIEFVNDMLGFGQDQEDAALDLLNGTTSEEPTEDFENETDEFESEDVEDINTSDSTEKTEA